MCEITLKALKELITRLSGNTLSLMNHWGKAWGEITQNEGMGEAVLGQ